MGKQFERKNSDSSETTNGNDTIPNNINIVINISKDKISEANYIKNQLSEAIKMNLNDIVTMNNHDIDIDKIAGDLPLEEVEEEDSDEELYENNEETTRQKMQNTLNTLLCLDTPQNPQSNN